MPVGRTARVAKTSRVTKSDDIVRIAQNSAYLPTFSIILYKERVVYVVLVQKREKCKPIELKSRKNLRFQEDQSHPNARTKSSTLISPMRVVKQFLDCVYSRLGPRLRRQQTAKNQECVIKNICRGIMPCPAYGLSA